MADLTTLSPEKWLTFQYVGAVVAAFVVYILFARIYNAIPREWQEDTALNTAWATTAIFSLSISPFGKLAYGLTRVFEMLPSNYVEFVKALVLAESAIALLGALVVLWVRGEWVGVSLFITACIGGSILSVSPTASFLIFGFSWLSLNWIQAL